jgi:small subunit ribosomal protein S20
MISNSITMGEEVLRLPNIKSAKKRVKVIAVKTLKNKAANSQLKTQIKKANAAIDSNAGDREAAVRAAVKKIDQAAAKGILHKNNAARKKAALARKLNAGA